MLALGLRARPGHDRRVGLDYLESDHDDGAQHVGPLALAPPVREVGGECVETREDIDTESDGDVVRFHGPLIHDSEPARQRLRTTLSITLLIVDIAYFLPVDRSSLSVDSAAVAAAKGTASGTRRRLGGPSTLARKLGAAITAKRRLLGISQEELAGRAGLHRTYLTSVEGGKRNPSLNALAQIASGLGIPMSELFRLMEAVEGPSTPNR